MNIPTSATSQSITVQVVDDTGLPVTGLDHTTFPALYYCLEGANDDVAFGTLNDLTTTHDSYNSLGLKERGRGYYRVDAPNAMLTTAGKVKIQGEATNKRVISPVIEVGGLDANLVTYTGYAITLDGDHFPTVNLKNFWGNPIPNRVSGYPTVNAVKWADDNIPTPNVTGRPLVDLTHHLGTITTAATAGIPDVNAKRINNVATTSVTTIGAFIGNATAALGVDASGRVDVGKMLGTAVTLDANSVLNVSTKYFGGTLQTARDIGASVLLSSGTGTGQLDFTSGVLKSNVTQFAGTTYTDTSGRVAAAFSGFFNVVSPTGTVNSLPAAVAGASGGVLISGSNAGTTTFGALTVTGALTVSGGTTLTNASNSDAVTVTALGTGKGIQINSANTCLAMSATGTSTHAVSIVGATVGVNIVGSNGDALVLTSTTGGNDIHLAGDGKINGTINGLVTAGYSAIALAVNTDTTNVTTAGSAPYTIVHQLGGSFTTSSSSVFTTAALVNGPSGGGGGSGSGAFATVIKVTSDGSTAIVGASVRISGAQSAVNTTDASGNASFSLDAGAVTVSVSAPGYYYNAASQTVGNTGLWVSSGSATLTLTMTANPVVSASSDPAKTTVYFTYRKADLTKIVGAVFTFTLIDPMATTDAWNQTLAQTATSDANGLVQIALAQSARWRVTGPDAKTYLDFQTTTALTFALPPFTAKF